MGKFFQKCMMNTYLKLDSDTAFRSTTHYDVVLTFILLEYYFVYQMNEVEF